MPFLKEGPPSPIQVAHVLLADFKADPLSSDAQSREGNKVLPYQTLGQTLGVQRFQSRWHNHLHVF